MVNPNMLYTVKRGENLSDIAQRHGTTPKQLCAINGIKNPNHIEEGQKIALSAKAVCKVSVQVLDRDRTPIKAAKVRMDYSGKNKEVTSGDKGWLPTILTKTPDDIVKISIARTDGTWKKITDVTSGWGNKIVTLVSPKVMAEGTTVLHPKDASGKPVRDNKPPAAPSAKPKKAEAGIQTWSQGVVQILKTLTTKDNKGLPIQTVSNEPRTVITPEAGLVPWMNHALRAAGDFKGAHETVIEKTINYHKAIGSPLPNMHENDNAWCASFANWCLEQAKYPISSPKSLGLEDRRRLADGFRQVHKGKKQVPNPLFIQIPEPVYGAIAVVVFPKGKRDERPGSHVGFVYGRSGKNKICILGGNQSDTICFTDYIEKEFTIINKIKIKKGEYKDVKKTTNHLEFYLPALYYPTYEKNTKLLPDVKTADANKTNKITIDKKKEGKTL